MKTKIGILYSTVDGQTLRICLLLKEILEEKGNSIKLFSVEDFEGNLAHFDKF